MTPADVRAQLVAALQLDLVGPHDGIGDAAETLPQHPSRWYLTGFLVPFDAGESQANDEELPVVQHQVQKRVVPPGSKQRRTE